MYKIQQITADPSQQQTLVLPNGAQIAFAMQYLPGQQAWAANVTYGSSFGLNGILLVNNPNLLQQWSNLIPFGMACFSSGAREPSQIQDFQSGYSALYILSAEDVVAYEEALQAGATNA